MFPFFPGFYLQGGGTKYNANYLKVLNKPYELPEGRRQGSGAVFWAKWKILDIKNLGGLYTSQNGLRTALLIGGGHGGCFNENGKF